LLIALVAHLLLPGGSDEPAEQRPDSPAATQPAV